MGPIYERLTLMNRTSLRLIIVLLSIHNSWAQVPDSWTVDVHSYEHTMTVTAGLEINASMESQPGDVLAAFVGEECRGVVAGSGVNGSTLYFLLIYGDTPNELIELQYWDAALNNVSPVTETVSFLSGGAVGTVDEPALLTAVNPISYVGTQGDAYTLEEDAAGGSALDVLSNDTFSTDLTLSLTIVDAPIHGTATLEPDQRIRYVSTTNFYGSDSLRYAVHNGIMGDTASVQLNITPVDDPLPDFHLINPPDATHFEDVNQLSYDFQWEAPEDVDGDGVTYSLYLRQNDQLLLQAPSSEPLVELELEGLPRSVVLTWMVTAFDAWGWTNSADTLTFSVDAAVGTAPQPEFPTSNAVGSAYPNPFNGGTLIPLHLASSQPIQWVVYDLRGQVVMQRDMGVLEAGNHVLTLQGEGLVSGVYVLQVSMKGYLQPIGYQKITVVQ